MFCFPLAVPWLFIYAIPSGKIFSLLLCFLILHLPRLSAKYVLRLHWRFRNNYSLHVPAKVAGGRGQVGGGSFVLTNGLPFFIPFTGKDSSVLFRAHLVKTIFDSTTFLPSIFSLSFINVCWPWRIWKGCWQPLPSVNQKDSHELLFVDHGLTWASGKCQSRLKVPGSFVCV